MANRLTVDKHSLEYALEKFGELFNQRNVDGTYSIRLKDTGERFTLKYSEYDTREDILRVMKEALSYMEAGDIASVKDMFPEAEEIDKRKCLFLFRFMDTTLDLGTRDYVSMMNDVFIPKGADKYKRSNRVDRLKLTTKLSTEYPQFGEFYTMGETNVHLIKLADLYDE